MDLKSPIFYTPIPTGVVSPQGAMGTDKSGKALPGWLVRHLETIGAIGNDRVFRTARPAQCRHCSWSILVGLDNDRCALPAHVDPWPLAPIGEALALLSGRTTYALHVGPGLCELQRRDSWQIRGAPAGTRYDVLAAHVCAGVHLPQAPTVNRLSEPLPTEPPF